MAANGNRATIEAVFASEHKFERKLDDLRCPTATVASSGIHGGHPAFCNLTLEHARELASGRTQRGFSQGRLIP